MLKKRDRVVGFQLVGMNFRSLRLALFGLAAVATVCIAACDQPSHKPVVTAAGPRPRLPPPPPPPPLTNADLPVALDALKRAADQGLSVKRFHTVEIERLLGSRAPADQAEGRGKLRAEVLAYARAQHGLTIPFSALPAAWRQRAPYDAEADLTAALQAGTFQGWLDALPPQTPEYQSLQAAYAEAEMDPAPPARPQLEAAPLNLGEQDDQTQALRQRLATDDPDLAHVDPTTPVDDDLIEALKAYQTHHHLNETGALDNATLEQLNTPVLSRADRLRVNLERLRWLPRTQPATRIEVNIAEAEMRYFRKGALSTQMRAVSGKLGDETPIVSSAVSSIVLDPPWYVPADIAHREIIPKGSAYMLARHFVWRGGRLIQLPGPKTALGLVKFDFPNPYSVYLHDTPSKAAFNQAQRAASHGCVRLEHAVAFARVLATDEPGLSAQKVDEILASGRTVRLNLAQPVPVRLTYLTMVSSGNAIAELPDVYGWDAPLLALLNRYDAPRRRP